MPEKYTEFEKQAMEKRRQGKEVRADVQETESGPPVVTLKEFVNRPDIPPPAPSPSPPPQPSPSVRPTEAQDVERMKDALFGQAETEEEQEEEPTEQEVEENLLAPSICPHCGWDTKNENVREPSDEDRLEFIESVLGERRFRKAVPLVGGNIVATFRTVTVPEEDAITEILNQDLASKEIQNTTEWTLVYNRARLVVMLERLKLGERERTFPTAEEQNEDGLPETIRRLMHELPATWPISIFGLLVQGMIEVNEVYNVLMARAYDSNFWTGRADESD